MGLTLLRTASEELVVKEQPLVQLSQRPKPLTPSSSQSSSSQSSHASSSSHGAASSRNDSQSQSQSSQSQSPRQSGLCLSEARKMQLYEAFAAYVPQALALLQQRLAQIASNASTPLQPQPESFCEITYYFALFTRS